MKKICILTPYYLPGYKAGGPITSMLNLINNLSKDYKFFVITSDRDLGDVKPYSQIKANAWNQIDSHKIYYVKGNYKFIYRLFTLLKKSNFDILYLNSFFSPWFTIFPLFLRRLKIIDINILLSTRGELHKNALGFKRSKKRFFLLFNYLLKLYKNINWHVTSVIEKEEILSKFKIEAKRIVVIPNFSSSVNVIQKKIKYINELQVLYLGRIHPTKNLMYILKIFQSIDYRVHLNIYGAIDDLEYWSECQNFINNNNLSKTVTYYGPVKHKELNKIFSRNHILLLPTKHENFGQVIFESLANGLPIIISQNTPWRNLERSEVGFDISLSDKTKFISKVNFFYKMDQKEYSYWSNNCLKYIRDNYNQEVLKEKYSNLFDSIV